MKTHQEIFEHVANTHDLDAQFVDTLELGK